jgi:hypothetical protein
MTRSPALILLLAACAPKAFAFSKPNHILITEYSLRELARCTPQETVLWTSAGELTVLGRRLTQLPADEDNITRERLDNWHFYDRFRRADGAPGLRHWGASKNATLHPLYESLSAQMAQTYDATTRVLLVGRLIHYLQDMAVPAHVLPVFHPRYGFQKDAVDSYPFRAPPAIDCEALKVEFGRIVAGAPAAERFFPELLDLAAQETLRPFTDPAADPLPVPWACYWKPNPAGWGEYGVGFGTEFIQCDGRSYQISSDDYANFMDRRHGHAARYTELAIYYLLFLSDFRP